MKLKVFLILVLLSTFITAQSNTLSFVKSNQEFTKTNSYNLVKGDIDNDGDIDVIFSNTNDSCLLMLNNGKGYFFQSKQLLPCGYPIVIGDLDNDNDLDLLIVEYNKGNVILFNDGKGQFTLERQNIFNSECTDIALGDLDNDGDLDAFITNWGHPTGYPNNVWFNDGKGNFSDTKQKIGLSISSAVALGDLDNDGDLDAFVTNKRDSSHNPLPNKVFINDGKGYFTDSGQNLGNSASKNVALGDLDGDGDLDAFVANTSHARKSVPHNKVWLNDGFGNFTDSGQKIGEYYSVDISLADLDGDKDLDAYVGNWLNPDKIWINDGNATFIDSKIKIDNSNSFGIGISDFDGDLDLDIFTIKNNDWYKVDDKNKVFFNQYLLKKPN